MNKHLARVLYKVGLRATLPAETINSVKIKDNAEELIDIKQNKNLFFSDKLQNREKVFLRKTVYEKLCDAQKYLPLNYYFKIYSAYRPIEEQQKLWNAKYLKFQTEHPDLSAEELTKLVKRVCADPRFGFGGHQTGGAVDIALCNDKGIDYSMGTKHSEVNEKTKTKSKFITKEEEKNRRILSGAMLKVGFVNYPQEWWHFSYGDRMWAAYKNKNNCVYGLVKDTQHENSC